MARRGRVTLSQADARLASIEEQMARLREQQESLNEARMAAIADDVVAALPEVRDGDYDGDLVSFLRSMRDDAMAYRELRSRPAMVTAPVAADDEDVAVDDEADDE